MTAPPSTDFDAFAEATPSSKAQTDEQATEAFFGTHQAGIVTPPHSSTYFASFDLDTDKRSDVQELLRTWTAEGARLTAGRNLSSSDPSSTHTQPDCGETVGLGPSRLTLNLGFGRTFFSNGLRDRFGLASRRPAALVELPSFEGDQLIHDRVGGDSSYRPVPTIQRCRFTP